MSRTGNNRLKSKIKTTSKVSLKLPIRINLGKQGAHVPSSQYWARRTSPPPQPTAWKRLSRGQKGPLVPTGTINNPFRTAQAGLHKQSATEAPQQDKPWKSRRVLASSSRHWTMPISPPLQPGKSYPQATKDPQFPYVLLITPSRLHKQSATEASQQDKPWKARHVLVSSSRLWKRSISSPCPPPPPTFRHSLERAKLSTSVGKTEHFFYIWALPNYAPSHHHTLPSIFQEKQPTSIHFSTKVTHSHSFFNKSGPLSHIFQ